LQNIESNNLAAENEDYEISEQIGHLIRKAHQRHTAIFQDLSIDKHLTPMQFATLYTVYNQGPCSLTDLVKHTTIDQATIRGVVNRLKTRKLVELVSDVADQRKVIVCLLKEGEKMIVDMLPYARKITEKTLVNLNLSERIALQYLLKKLDSDI
jgi:DNA-binding MarR family transcriptional regulator